MLYAAWHSLVIHRVGHRAIMGTDEEPADPDDRPVVLDERRGMQAQKATEIRRHLADIEADQRALRTRQEELEKFLLASPATTWIEAAEKARYLLTLLAATSAGRNSRRRKIIAGLLDDFGRLSANSSLAYVSPPLPTDRDANLERARRPAHDGLSLWPAGVVRPASADAAAPRWSRSAGAGDRARHLAGQHLAPGSTTSWAKLGDVRLLPRARAGELRIVCSPAHDVERFGSRPPSAAGEVEAAAAARYPFVYSISRTHGSISAACSRGSLTWPAQPIWSAPGPTRLRSRQPRPTRWRCSRT